MKEVTLQVPTFSELSSINIAKSLYIPDHLPLTSEESYLLNQRLAEGYRRLKDNPEIIKLIADLRHYYSHLKKLGLQDNQV